MQGVTSFKGAPRVRPSYTAPATGGDMNEDMTNLMPLALGLGGGVVVVAVIWLVFAIVKKTKGD